jgi:hypothetical protein
MPDEDDLRRLLRSTDAPNTLDAKRIVSRSRTRRLPRQIAAGTLGAFALAGVTVLAVQITQIPAPVTMTAGEAFDQSAPAAPESSVVKRAPADKINLCAGTVSDVAPSQYGLQLDVIPPESAPASTAPITATVRMTNTSDTEVVGFTPASPSLTLSHGGVVLWHSNGVADVALRDVDLAPGASVDYTAELVPVRCGVDDDLAESFRTDLPALEPGSYELSALLDFTPDSSMQAFTAELDLVSGPPTTIILE